MKNAFPRSKKNFTLKVFQLSQDEKNFTLQFILHPILIL